MQIISIKTHKITTKDNNLFKILDKYLIKIKNNSILVITSKIISITQGRVVKVGKENKKKLIKKEAELYLEQENKYGFILTIKNGILMPSAGIDESNSNGFYILHPKDLQETANKIRIYLCKRFKLKNVGVLITDSKTTPLRWGTTGIALAHSGFLALNDYIDTPDIFGRKLKVTKVNVSDGLAAAAVLVIGEGREQTPLAIISETTFVKFQNRNPTKKELANMKISLTDDLYSPILSSVFWKKNPSG